MKNAFKPQIFVCPLDQESNQSIAQHPDMLQVDPCINAEVYFGKNKINLSLLPVGNILFNTLKRTRGLAFYAFTQSKESGHKQYFYSQNVKKPDNSFAKSMAKLLEQLETQKTTRE